jgi:hypothetical protein
MKPAALLPSPWLILVITDNMHGDDHFHYVCMYVLIIVILFDKLYLKLLYLLIIHVLRVSIFLFIYNI